MADVGTAIRALAIADASLRAEIGDRMYPDRRPQTASYPCLTYTVDSDESHEHMGGLSGFAECLVEVQSYATTRLKARSVHELARLALSRQQGTYAGVVVRHVHPGVGSSYEIEPEDGSDDPIYVEAKDYRVFYTEAT